jgi:hypothetical protein
MQTFLQCWFSIGVGYYLGLWTHNPLGWLKASAAGLIRGFILCVPFWPIALVIKIVEIMVEPLPPEPGDKYGTHREHSRHG